MKSGSLTSSANPNGYVLVKLRQNRSVHPKWSGDDLIVSLRSDGSNSMVVKVFLLFRFLDSG